MNYEEASEARQFLARRLAGKPSVGLVLGSGLDGFSRCLAGCLEVPFAEIPHWPRSTVPGHAGKFLAGAMEGKTVAVLAGRAHLYEGYSASQVAFPVRVLGLLGVRTLVLTNAAGGLNPAFRASQLVLISDHLNLQGTNPLMGENDDRFGPRFPDLGEVYPARLRQTARECGRQLGLDLGEGVYAALTGPNYETPAEIRYLRGIGADMVGMSTAAEALAAAHMGIPVLGISCISNVISQDAVPRKITHQEVLAAAERATDALTALLQAVIPRL